MVATFVLTTIFDYIRKAWQPNNTRGSGHICLSYQQVAMMLEPEVEISC